MTSQWYFNQPKPGDKNREPVLGEFFATDAIKNPAEALIRESIQNALDAALDDKTVGVRIYVSGDGGALAPHIVGAYMAGSWPHISATGNGLHDAPTKNESCPFLAIEDFGTSGLTGDVRQWHDLPGTRNPFYYFFRAEGQSDKGEHDRGRWGVGKTVFPRSSRVSSYFGLTVRADDRKRLLMGGSILKSHYAADAYYSPDGYYGVKPDDNLTLPIDEPRPIERFIEDFRLTRGSEPGLSVVVPWCDPEIDAEAIVEAVCRDYFYPILAATLQVTVSTPESDTLINHETLLGVSRGIADRLPQGFTAVLEMADWATQRRPNDLLHLSAPPSNRGPAWSPELISDEQLKTISALLKAGERLALRVPLVVRKKNEDPRPSFFDVFLVRDMQSEGGRPVFIREGIIISDIRSPRNRGVTSLVVVEDEPLATLLGDSENPAHTQWQRDSSNYKGKYFYGPAYIQFVVRSIHEILQILSEGEAQIDPTLLLDLFFLPEVEEQPEEPEEKESEPSRKLKPTFPPPRPRRFIVQKVAGGFSVTQGPKAESIPAFLDIRVAYDIRRGNPLNKYEPVDFDLAQLSVVEEGVERKRLIHNNIVVAVKAPEFKVSVKGFDDRRDLYVKVNAREDFDDSTN
ncbi:MAG TPA: hypothetical protein DC047_03515 [Blastocatellia bacterium]|nr:hypothetical protein [Blastocatellia bacterium]